MTDNEKRKEFEEIVFYTMTNDGIDGLFRLFEKVKSELKKDLFTTLQQEIEKMKYELDENNPQYPIRLTYNQALDAVLTLLKDIQHG